MDVSNKTGGSAAVDSRSNINGRSKTDVHYNSEKNVQMLISLMKANGIRKVIASPGTTNIAFVGSIQ